MPISSIGGGYYGFTPYTITPAGGVSATGTADQNPATRGTSTPPAAGADTSESVGGFLAALRGQFLNITV